MKQYQLYQTKSFRQDLRRAERRCKDLQKLYRVLTRIQEGIPLPARYRRHLLRQAAYREVYELHLEPDWLLLYKIIGTSLVLLRNGSHADIF